MHSLEQVFKIIGFITMAISSLAVIAGVVWYIWKGRDFAQLKESEQGWKSLAEQKQAKIAQMTQDKADVDKRNEELEKAMKSILKLIARAQGAADLEQARQVALSHNIHTTEG